MNFTGEGIVSISFRFRSKFKDIVFMVTIIWVFVCGIYS